MRLLKQFITNAFLKVKFFFRLNIIGKVIHAFVLLHIVVAYLINFYNDKFNWFITCKICNEKKTNHASFIDIALGIS